MRRDPRTRDNRILILVARVGVAGMLLGML